MSALLVASPTTEQIQVSDCGLQIRVHVSQLHTITAAQHAFTQGYVPDETNHQSCSIRSEMLNVSHA